MALPTPHRLAARAGTVARLLLALCLCASGPLRADDGAPSPAAPVPHTDTPRAAMSTYLEAVRAGDYERAAAVLDLRQLPPAERAARGATFAWHLGVVLDRTLWIDPEAFSDAPQGDVADGLPPQRERVGTITTRRGPVDVLLERVALADGTLQWRIASATVARIPRLYAEFGYGALSEVLPAPLFEIRFFDVQLWQWIGLLVLVFVAGGLSWLATTVLVRSLRPVVLHAGFAEDLLRRTAQPLRVGIALMIVSAGGYVLALSAPAQAFLNATVTVLTIFTVTWLLVRVVDLLAQGVEQHFAARDQHAAIAVVPLGRRTVKAVCVTIALLAALQNLGFNVTGLLAGLGIGGLAIALAAQKTVENLFGGVTLITDQPVRVGDFCRFGDQIGTVEDIGLRSTRVRTLERTVVSIPNAQFSALQLENFTRRDHIWLHATIGLRYETTPDQLRFVLVELKRLLLSHPRIHPQPARVRFVGFGAYSLDLELFAYVLTTDYDEFLAVREDVFLRIMEIVTGSGTGFAFPSQTLYAAADAGLDGPRSRAAEEQVQRWRAENRLCLPDVPPAVAAALARSLDYPSAGSAARR